MSPSSFTAAKCAKVPPMWPAPIKAIFLRAMEFLPLFETAALSLERPRELTPRAIVLSLHAIKSNFWRKAPENLVWRAPLDPLLRDINGL